MSRLQGNKIVTLGQAVIADKTKKAMEFEAVTQEIRIGDIQFVSERQFRFGENFFNVSPAAVQDFFGHLRLSKGFMENTVGKLFGEGVKNDIINQIKSAVSANSEKNVIMVISPATQKVVRLLAKSNINLSHNAFLDFANRIIDKNNLEIIDFLVEAETGSVTINTINRQNEFQVGKLKNEVFWNGLTFSNTFGLGTFITPHMMRLICGNGTIASNEFKDVIALRDITDVKKNEQFYQKIAQLSARNFVPQKFEEKVKIAMATQASVKEMEEIFGTIVSHCNGDNASLKDEVSAFIDLQKTYQGYAKIGIPVDDMTYRQRQNGKGHMKIWDLFNAITDIASHEYHGLEMDDYSRTNLKITASKLLAKEEYDTQSLVKSPF